MVHCILVAVLFLATVVFLGLFLQYRARLHRAENRYGRTRIPTVTADKLDSSFSYDEIGPSLSTEIFFMGRGGLPIVGATSDTEAWILSVLAKKADTMFEFGTGTGRIAYLWAKNSSPNARVTTLTLHPDQKTEYRADSKDNSRSTHSALAESRYVRFVYSGTPEEKKIQQLFGDSKAYDETPLVGKCDLVFVDGAHTYSYLESDTAKALRMVKPGGLVLWHDFRRGGEPKDVFRFLHNLAQKLELVNLAETSLVAFRSK